MKWEDYGISGVKDLINNKWVGSKFGKNLQLEVLGQLPESMGPIRLAPILVLCRICELDSGLFGEGIFRTTIRILKQGTVPCGCSTHPKWSEEQMLLRAKRICSERGYTFMNWVEPYKANITKIELLDNFGEATTIMLSNLLNGGYPYSNKKRSMSVSKTKTDEHTISTFFKTNSYHIDTIFTKSDRLDAWNRRTFWHMVCGFCGGGGESARSSFQSGYHPCDCSFHNQKKAYVHLVFENDLPIAIKFGRSIYPEKRLQKQQSKCVFEMRAFGVWEFEDRKRCFDAEVSCIETFDCGVLSHMEMADGWTETTHVYNLDNIIAIYAQYGGIRIS